MKNLLPKLFNGVTLVFVGATAILDLIFLTIKDVEFGAGFVLAFFYAVTLGYFTTKKAGTK
jgi:hypothetical protein